MLVFVWLFNQPKSVLTGGCFVGGQTSEYGRIHRSIRELGLNHTSHLTNLSRLVKITSLDRLNQKSDKDL